MEAHPCNIFTATFSLSEKGLPGLLKSGLYNIGCVRV
jgi:hypothetical protein